MFAALKRALHADGAAQHAEAQLRTTIADARTVFDDPAARAAREAWHD
ncbi:hypothetical protein GTY54_32285 [Streptomyces sp. SID625]|nr:hypothetical protein [Streptomyces sp. SID625]